MRALVFLFDAVILIAFVATLYTAYSAGKLSKSKKKEGKK